VKGSFMTGKVPSIKENPHETSPRLLR